MWMDHCRGHYVIVFNRHTRMTNATTSMKMTTTRQKKLKFHGKCSAKENDEMFLFYFFEMIRHRVRVLSVCDVFFPFFFYKRRERIQFLVFFFFRSSSLSTFAHRSIESCLSSFVPPVILFILFRLCCSAISFAVSILFYVGSFSFRFFLSSLRRFATCNQKYQFSFLHSLSKLLFYSVRN